MSVKYGAIEIIIIVIDIIVIIITTPLHLVGGMPESQAHRKRAGKPGLKEECKSQACGEDRPVIVFTACKQWEAGMSQVRPACFCLSCTCLLNL